MLPRVWSIYCRGEAAAALYPEQQSTKDGARAFGAPSNRPGQEFHGDWGACSPHHHPYPPAYPSRPPQPAAALPPRPLPPPALPTDVIFVVGSQVFKLPQWMQTVMLHWTF